MVPFSIVLIDLFRSFIYTETGIEEDRETEGETERECVCGDDGGGGGLRVKYECIQVNSLVINSNNR